MKANQAKTTGAKQVAAKLRSTWPRAPKHGKHTDVQGFANTRGKKG